MSHCISPSIASAIAFAALGFTTRPAQCQDAAPWRTMDYGPAVATSLDLGNGHVVAKALVVQADPGQPGFASGRSYLAFDTDTLSCVAGWVGSGGIDWRGRAFDGNTDATPAIVGALLFQNPNAPGWASGDVSTFGDSRATSADGSRIGPLTASRGQYKGQYRCDGRVVLSYEVFGTAVLESALAVEADEAPILIRQFEVGPRSQDLQLQVARDPSETPKLHGEMDAATVDQTITIRASGARGNNDRRHGRSRPGDEEEFEDEEEEEVDEDRDEGDVDEEDEEDH